MIQISNAGTATRNNWILETSAGVIAVDTGLPGQADGFLKRFCKRWRLEDLKYIFLTHAHVDHAGFLADLLVKSHAQAVLSPKAIPVLAKGNGHEPHEYKNWFGSILERSMKSAEGDYPPVTDTGRLIAAEGGSTFFRDLGLPIDILELPGHTWDSIGLHLLEDHIIICGDAAMNRPILNANRHTVIIENIAAFQSSWDKMLALKPAMLYPGHGKPFPAKDLVQYRNYLRLA